MVTINGIVKELFTDDDDVKLTCIVEPRYEWRNRRKKNGKYIIDLNVSLEKKKNCINYNEKKKKLKEIRCTF